MKDCPFRWRSKQRNVKGRLTPTMYMLDLKYRQRLLTAVCRRLRFYDDEDKLEDCTIVHCIQTLGDQNLIAVF